VRRIFASCLVKEERPEGDRLIYRVRGSGFLKHMVRNIVGVLLEVGKGNLAPGGIEARLKPGCKIPAGPSAPARGLFLVNVEYPKENPDEQSCRQPTSGPATSDGPPA
jgi:tRNA pseudouridine38-40 synthase